MRTENDDQVNEWFPLKNGNIMVKLQDHDGADDNGYSKKVNSQPCHLGFSILSHSKRLMNDVILAIDSFKNNTKLLFRHWLYLHSQKRLRYSKNKRFNSKGIISV